MADGSARIACRRVVSSQCDDFFYVAVLLVPKLDEKRQIELCPAAIRGSVKKKGKMTRPRLHLGLNPSRRKRTQMLTSLDDKIGHLNDRKYVFTHRNDTAEQASRR